MCSSSCGAKVLGPFKMGDNARIASNAVVLSEVPPDATAVGIPAQIVRIAGKTTHYADEVDQTSVENPTLEKLEALSQRVELLEKLLDEKFMEEKNRKECRVQSEECLIVLRRHTQNRRDTGAESCRPH